jgi:hypothetical protein
MRLPDDGGTGTLAQSMTPAGRSKRQEQPVLRRGQRVILDGGRGESMVLRGGRATHVAIAVISRGKAKARWIPRSELSLSKSAETVDRRLR